MKNKNPSKILGLAALALAMPLLSGCNIYDILESLDIGGGGNQSSTVSIPEHSLTESHVNDFDGYYQPSKVNDSASYQILGHYNQDPVTPSLGDLNILVVPVEFSDSPFSSSTLEDIRTLTAGSAEDTKYWESLGSFYKKSSYGRLNLSFTQMDKVSVGSINSFTRGTPANEETFLPGEALRKAVAQYKSLHGADSTQAFDSDKDGYIDAVIMIYSAPNYTNSLLTKDHEDLFWAYCYADYKNEAQPSTLSPIGHRYFWASYDFFYTGTGTPAIHTGVDAHTLIHEAGHLMGSDDFYNIAREGKDVAEPSGGLMMMAWNVGDHDMFSKLSFGWTEPYVVTDDCTIQIRPSQSSGDCILLADSWNGTAFDEYVLIDYYTPTGLSEHDAKNVYPEYRGKTNETAYRSSGIRVFHIDSRLCYGVGFSDDGVFMADGYLTDAEVADFGHFDKTVRYQGQLYQAYVMPAISNCAAYDCSLAQGKGYELIQLVQKGKRDTTKDGSLSTSADLFQKGDSFSLSEYSAFFPNRTKLNNGSSLPYYFTIDDIGSDGAILSFKKVA